MMNKNKECDLKDCGVSHLVKNIECNCFRNGTAYSHKMDNHCVNFMRKKIKEFEEAEIECMTTNNGVKFIK